MLDQPPGRPLYRLERIEPRRLASVTGPRRATVNAIVKSDGPEAEHCVYDEFVASQLGQMMGLPVAAGVLLEKSNHVVYASLELATIADRPARISPRRAATLYPAATAGLLVFDILIGNRDRARNFCVGRAAGIDRLMAFDHSHALLDIESTVDRSLSRLGGGDLIAINHPFRDLVEAARVQTWLDRIEAFPDSTLLECCLVGSVGEASEAVQQDLAVTLVKRRRRLRELLVRVASRRS